MINGVHAMIEAEKACAPKADEAKPVEEVKAEPEVVAEAAPI